MHMRWVADIVYLLAGLLYLPVAIYNAIFLAKNRRGWRQRFGGLPIFDPTVPRIWIHAVSLGEINATPRLVAALRERLPETDIVLSTTTDTGYARAVQLYGADLVFRFPLDFSSVVARVLRRVRPTMIVLVELEIWYNLVRMATRRGIPVAVVNGRLTQRSARRFRWLGPFGRSMFGDLTWVGAQDDTIAARFRSLGVPPDRIEVTSSLKWDTAEISDRIDGADEAARSVGLDRSRPIWVCGSTGPGEEELILEAYRVLLESDYRYVPPERVMKLVVAPRRPERFDDVAKLIESRDFTCSRRSACPDGSTFKPVGNKDRVVLVDTLGELRKFYSLATFVFVGRTLVPLGGSDPMEVAALAKPIIMGPHFDNFQSSVAALQAARALRVVSDVRELVQGVTEFLENPANAAEAGRHARQVVLRNQGATQRTVDRLMRLMPDGAPGPTPFGGMGI